MNAPINESIEGHPFFEGMSPDLVKPLADAAMRTEFKAGEIIFHEGDLANRFYLIEHGSVVLESRPPGRPPVAIQTIGSGDVLGWSWLFPPYCWNFDARAVAPTTAIFFYGTRLRERCEEDPKLGYELMRRMSALMLQRLQATRKQLLEARYQQ